MGGQDEFRIRRASEADGDAIRKIVENNPDGGAVSFAPQFEVNPYELHTAAFPETVGFVAETADGNPAGTGFVNYFDARFGGERRPSAYLNNLAVAAEYRNRGLATRLARRRLDHAASRDDEDRVVWATIQQGNEPSRAVASSWAETFAYEQARFVLEPRSGSADTAGYEVREATPPELEVVCDRANEFYAGAELFAPYTPEGLQGRLDRSPLDDPIARYVVALDGDEVVAGAQVMETHRAMWIAVEGEELPPALPDDGELRPRAVGNPWFVDGASDALRALVAHLRTNPGGANRLAFNSGQHDPITGLLHDLGATRATEQTNALRGVADPLTDRPIASPY